MLGRCRAGMWRGGPRLHGNLRHHDRRYHDPLCLGDDRCMHREHRGRFALCRPLPTLKYLEELMSSPWNSRRILVGIAGVVGFSFLMAARDAFSNVLVRALVAGLAALVAGSAFVYLQTTASK